MIQLMQPMLRPVTRPMTRWAERSQRGACRNAMVASTDLAERRREQVEVAEYLERALARDPQPHLSAAPTLPAAQLG